MPQTLPPTMTCIEISEPGGPEVLRPIQRPVPMPGPDEILIKVAAAGVNRPDMLQREGGYPPPPGASDIPGLEVAGTIVARGSDDIDLLEGDAVCALVTGGGYAEYCVAPRAQVLPVPKGLDMVSAAALPETFFTVWSNLIDRAHLHPNETLLVHGGSSGIGTTAIQIASRLGSRVFATAGSPEKCAACEKLGAERAINYRKEDYVAVVKECTDGKGVNVILDMVGGDYVQRNIKALAPEGRLVNIAFLKGAKVEVDLMPAMLKRLTLTGSTLRARPVADKGAIAQALWARVWPMIERGDIAPVIHATFPLSDAAAAHRMMMSGDHIGKIILTTEN
ncbi:MAG: NAD(P)H-quinone oxidoreductase [Magnetospiraceae bacterium]